METNQEPVLEDKSKRSLAGPVLVIIAAALWAFDGLIRQHLYTLPPITIIFFEHVIGFLVLAPFIWRKALRIRLSGRDWWLLILIAALSGLLGTLWFTAALGRVHFITISVVFLLQKLQPIFAISTAAIFLKEKLHKDYLIWAVLALIAAYFVTFPGGTVNFGTGAGTAAAALLALGAAFAWGSSTTFSKMLLGKMDFKTSTFYRFLFTLAIALPFVLIFGRSSAGAFVVPALWQLGLLVLIAVSTGMVALLIYYKGLAKVSVHVSTILELTFPFLAIILDMIVNHTRLTAVQWVAALILVFAIYRIAKLRENLRQTNLV